MWHCIVPPYLLEKIADSTASTAARAAAATLGHDASLRAIGRIPPGLPPSPTVTPGPRRTIENAHNTDNLTGDIVRTEGEREVADPAVNEAYDALGATYGLYDQAYHRNSIDDRGLPLNATVHYGHNYDNAFWNGERMVFGDGDGEIFGRFTRSISVIGHELTHGVTQYTAGLDYRGQSGALNESISDVFGALTEQHALGQTAREASWLIGAGLFLPGVHGTAIRSMKAPGTAYDDPRLGKDPQPATMHGYVHADSDDGGVHTNSGIPNHAFYLIATTIGGFAADKAGRIWYETLSDGALAADADFAAFAHATIDTATRLYGTDSTEAAAVTDGWRKVGVVDIRVHV